MRTGIPVIKDQGLYRTQDSRGSSIDLIFSLNHFFLIHYHSLIKTWAELSTATERLISEYNVCVDLSFIKSVCFPVLFVTATSAQWKQNNKKKYESKSVCHDQLTVEIAPLKKVFQTHRFLNLIDHKT